MSILLGLLHKDEAPEQTKRDKNQFLRHTFTNLYTFFAMQINIHIHGDKGESATSTQPSSLVADAGTAPSLPLGGPQSATQNIAPSSPHEDGGNAPNLGATNPEVASFEGVNGGAAPNLGQ